MRAIIFLSIMFAGLIGFSQTLPTPGTAIDINSINTKKFIIGVGNSGSDIYNNVLEFLQNDNAITIYAVCEGHHIIGFEAKKDIYKSYDEVRDLLISEYPEIVLNKKDDTIFTKDCSDEIKKQ
jgi:hypothetical protein